VFPPARMHLLVLVPMPGLAIGWDDLVDRLSVVWSKLVDPRH